MLMQKVIDKMKDLDKITKDVAPFLYNTANSKKDINI